MQVVLVADGPDEATAAVLDSFDSEASVAVLRPGPRLGQAGAIVRGVTVATGEVIVTIDDDLGHRPEDVPTLVAAVHAGAEVAYGRVDADERSRWRRTASAGVRRLLGVAMGREMGRAVSPFRAFDARLSPTLIAAGTDVPSVDLVLARDAASFCSVQVASNDIDPSHSSYTVPRLVRLTARMATAVVRERRAHGRRRVPDVTGPVLGQRRASGVG
jgi:glycosyltransferase involved in cell wall biosynthesis